MDAAALTFVSAEHPYFDSLTLDEALLSGRDARLRDGRQAADAPARRARAARDPEMYGYKGVKWVEQIALGAIPETGYWEQHG